MTTKKNTAAPAVSDSVRRALADVAADARRNPIPEGLFASLLAMNPANR